MGTNRLPEMQCFETQRHRGHGEGKKEVEGEIGRGKNIERGESGLDLRGLEEGSRRATLWTLVPLCFKKRGLKHRDTESTERGRKRWRGMGSH
jgi:hypothetical protein